MYAEKWWTSLEYRSVVLVVAAFFLVEIEKQQYETASILLDDTAATASDSTTARLHVISLESIDDRTRPNLIVFVTANRSADYAETHSSRWATFISTN